ncbi:PREDICTED: COMM domain-containing protein 9-like [Amphimedon queenslandica]|uniref:COMM domain-containing protein n=1 Tax=Amphimedon queenslandica TaxID=400682 RepID=A0A1X7V8E2_AMPQE|nr:PREDICTED: COMM domain-containing protein 9-like [Amphimedon queenslandica]|eukprot:XP_003385410.1 PREDICTED: COMM domain-containing protein 9-like [Amphimedon queenslandica]
MALSSEELSGLEFLLKAQSKSVVVGILKEGFVYRNDKVPDQVLASVAQSLNIQPSEVITLFQSVTLLVKKALYECVQDQSDASKIFPDDFHNDLRKLLSDIIVKNMSEWRTEASKSQVSLPRLVDFDWRVNIKSASDSVSRMAAPTCLLQMKVQPSPVNSSELPNLESINVEFNKEKLDTMLDGLGKIRDQLSSVAKATT